MEHRDLLAFGGPWNGNVMRVRSDRSTFLAPIEHKVSYSLDHAPLEAFNESFRTGTYHVETLAFHDPDKCVSMLDHDERCKWQGRCLVYDGYPKDRIVGAMNVIIGLALTARGYRSTRGAPTS